MVMANNNNLNYELMAKCLLSNIIFSKDMEKYKKVPMLKLLSRQNKLLCEVASMTFKLVVFKFLWLLVD